jgi:hypothetical protein
MTDDTGMPTVGALSATAEPTWGPWSAVRSFTTEPVYVPPPPEPPPVKPGKGWGKGGKK